MYTEMIKDYLDNKTYSFLSKKYKKDFRTIKNILKANNIKLREKTKNIKPGDKFGQWTIIKYSHSEPKKGRMFLCECYCGKQYIIQACNLYSKLTTKCKECAWKNQIKISKVPQKILHDMKKKCKKRNLEFNITENEIFEILEKQNFKCALSGVNIIFGETATNHKKNTTASIDRIDNSKGYTKENIQIVHKIINIMRNKFEIHEYINWCNLVSNHNKE